MKFGRLLRDASAELPEMESLFNCYKQLKKQLKRIHTTNHPSGCDSISSDEPERSTGSASSAEEAAQADARKAMPPPPPAPPGSAPRSRDTVAEHPSAEEVRRTVATCSELTPEEAGFIQALIENVQRFNDMFLEKEEQSIIHMRGLADAKAGAPDSLENLKCVYKEYVDLHGDLLLLMHWSVLAYTGLVKILKKHHKRTGLLLRAPFLSDLLAQPFCSTEATAGLVRKAEEEIGKLSLEMRRMESSEAVAVPGDEPSAGSSAAHSEAVHLACDGTGGPLSGTKRPAEQPADGALAAGMRRAQVALGTWRQLSETASTPSTVCTHTQLREGTPVTQVSGC